MHLESYFSHLSDNPDLVNSIKDTINAVIPSHVKTFTYKEHLTGLLLGHVQSGKTGQMFGLISAAADEEFKIFVLLTTDNVYLQQQTFERALKNLDNTFAVCGENDYVRFSIQRLNKPILLILKKNTKILENWRNHLASSKFCEGRPIFIIDDEADAASLNTKINKEEQSQINFHLDSIKQLASSSIYLQVTATPQGILLQTFDSGWKPTFVHYFPPGQGYLGGDFFYNDSDSPIIRLTEENELDNLRQPSEYIADGLKESLMTFLVTASSVFLSGGSVCNFLIHPSVKISDHEAIADKIGEYLNEILSTFSEESMKNELENLLREAWNDLKQTKNDIIQFELILAYVHTILDEQKLNKYVMNSKNTLDINLKVGINIIVGGNSLGRGVTFPVLQTVYYCRQSKTPQADTFWQHCRMFGYDRDPDLMRIFIPPSLWRLFFDLNSANLALIEQIKTLGINEVSLLYPPKIKPTRKNIIDQEELNVIVGGVNFFLGAPKESNCDKIDNLLSNYDDNQNYHEITIEQAIELLSLTEAEPESIWNNIHFINGLKALQAARPDENIVFIVRRNRSIGKETRTLLSPNDRSLGDSFSRSVLTMYRINGETAKGWKGQPLWIPNIKFPRGLCIYKTDN